MINIRKLFRKKNIIIFTLVLILYILFHTRKQYVIHNEGISDFPKSQLYELEQTDAVLNIGQQAVFYVKKNPISFFVFSVEDFFTLTVNDIILRYDNKEKRIKCGKSYPTNTGNPNYEKYLTLDLNEKTIEGYYKFIDPDAFFDKNCFWINFYNLFKWRHWYIGAEFPITIIINYKLDDREYSQELNYTVTCEKDYPSNWFMAFFGGFIYPNY